MISTQDSSHPCNFMLHHPLSQRQRKQTTSLHYIEILNNILTPSPNTFLQKHIHNSIAASAIQNLQPNNKLQEHPPGINPLEITLPREIRANLARLRCGHYLSLNQYKNRLDPTQDPLCPHCSTVTSCTPLTQLRQSYNIFSARDLWERPVEAANYLQSIGLVKT